MTQEVNELLAAKQEDDDLVAHLRTRCAILNMNVRKRDDRIKELEEALEVAQNALSDKQERPKKTDQKEGN